ncbi:MAG: hypothetical protein HQL86_01695 [Magnetococcales bacterium]|nr:hypothetical protein [Magnetococcales bacterium]
MSGGKSLIVLLPWIIQYGATRRIFNLTGLNRTHHGMRRFPTGCVQDVGVVSKKRKRLPRRRRAAHCSQKTRKMLFLKSAVKSKVKPKPWEMNLPDPLFFSPIKTTHSKLGAVYLPG